MKKLRKLRVPLRFDPAASDYQKYVFEIALFLAAVVVITLNLPFTQVPVLVDGSYVAGETDFPIDILKLTKPVKTGWPLTFYHSHQFGTATNVSSWDFGSLLFDMLAGVALIGLVGLISWPRRKRVRLKSRVKSKFVYAGVAVAVAACFAAYLGSLLAAGSRDQQISEELRRHGDVVRIAFIPEVLASVLPESWTRHRLRIALVDLNGVDDRVVQLAVEQPELRSLRLSGSEFSPKKLANLDRLKFLQDVAIKSTELTVSDLDGLVKCRLVSTLNLSGTKVGTEELNAIALMPRLFKLSLFESDVPLSDVTGSKLKKKLTHLIASRPDSESDTLNLNKWYQLRELRLLSRSTTPNPNLLRLEIADLPLFSSLFIDPRQRIELSAKNVSLLHQVTAQRDIDFGLETKPLGTDKATLPTTEPVGLWIETLRIIEAGNLKSLVLDGRNIRFLSIDDCKLMESVTILGNAVNPMVLSQTDPNPPAPIDQDVRQQVISSLSDQVKNVAQIRLPGMKLDDLQLEPLTYNVGITNLDLQGATIDLKSMQTLREMRQLRELDLTGITLDPQTFVWINKAFPKLERLRVSHEFAKRILFENHSMLKGLILDRYTNPQIDALKLVNLKSWSSPITMADDVRIVTIEGLPSLTGLGIPRPCKLKLREVGGLDWFASGGSNCSDEVVTELLKAKGLRHLVLVSPTAGADTMAGVRELRELENLNVAGSLVDDVFLASWKVPSTLRSLIIDDCPITDTGFSTLMLHQTWESISLARTDVSSQALGSLRGQTELRALGLAGLTLDLDVLESLQGLPQLKFLDLQGTNLPPGATTALQKFIGLEQVNLSDCSLTETEIDSIKASLPELIVTSERNSWDFNDEVVHGPNVDERLREFAMPRLRWSMFRREEKALTSSR